MLTRTCLGIVQPWWSRQILLKSGFCDCWLAGQVRTETSQQKPAMEREDRELPETGGAEFRKN